MTSKNALICSYYTPQPDLDSFSRRLFHFVEFLREEGWSVTCVAKTSTGQDQPAAILGEMGVPVYLGSDEHVERLAGAERFDVAILGFWHVAEPLIKILRGCSPATRILVDSGDVHFLRHARRVLREWAPKKAIDMLNWDYAYETVRELNVYAAADAVFTVSRKEANLLSDFVGEATRAYVVPDCEELAVSPVPFGRRRGMFFVGNFEHKPNVEAVDFLCGEVLPQFDPALLADHPVYIAGNAMTDAVCMWGEGLPCVRMLGWVPSIEPYLRQVRVSLVPLLHGAGTKRKMIQALAVGTPTVSTSVGVEGFDLRDGEEVLVGDDPVAFANNMARLLQEEELWARLARRGRDYMLAQHSREAGKKRLIEALSSVTAAGLRPEVTRSGGPTSSQAGNPEYRQIVQRTVGIVSQAVPLHSTVIVVNKGDWDLLHLGERGSWHFPRTRDGAYAGCDPATGADAIAHLEALRGQGGDFLVFPKTAFGWFERYPDFKTHLEARYRVAACDWKSCIIFSLGEPPAPGQPVRFPERNGDTVPDRPIGLANGTEPVNVESRRPVAMDVGGLDRNTRPMNVLVVGVYLADQYNNIIDIVETLSRSSHCRLVQRWAALGGQPPSQAVAGVTAQRFVEKRPKFEILNALLSDQDLSEYDYVLVCDDDIVLPHDFLDRFIALQEQLEFAIAQPALTTDSFINHPIVEQQRGVIARETSFVEIGPVISFHRTVFPLVFPFDLASPMGWGYESVWASRLGTEGKAMGIIDAVLVDHGLRASVSNYSWEGANRQREAFLAKHGGHSAADPFRVLAVTGHQDTRGQREVARQRIRKSTAEPRISVVIPTHNRAGLLECSLHSLGSQSLPASDWEVVVVDDGSDDATGAVCETWSSRLPLTYLRIQQSGIAAAKNLGLFAARSPVVLFFDDDDVADENMLGEHLKTHARYPLENVAVLGFTDWAPALEISEVMRYVTDVGHYLFSYTHLADGQRLDFTYFWGGRTSCKKSLLTRAGVYRQEFEFGSEDIEAAFRISKLLVEWRLLHRKFEVNKEDAALKHQLATIGLAVIFNRRAIQHMNRPLTYAEYCRRCERQGKSQMQFSRLHADSIVHEWCQTTDALDRWERIGAELPSKVARVHALEAMLKEGPGPAERRAVVNELHQLYGWTFDAFKIKGIAQALRGHQPVAPAASPDFFASHKLA
jgi:glycosyltransferase involved in cell wall biosynthesis